MSLLTGLSSCRRRYVVVQQTKTWSDAQSYCRSKYTDLATMDTMVDVNQMIADAAGFIGTVWIGLSDKGFNWMWSKPGGVEPLTYFPQVKPSNPRNMWELCGAQLKGSWWDVLCNQELPFVCYDMVLSPIPTKNYVFINQALTWNDAQAYCRQNHTDLASVMSKAEDDDITKVIPSETLTFIGLHRPTWTWWSDGSVHKLDHWIQGHPQGGTGDCAASLIDAANVGKFMEYTCGTHFYFMCYTSKLLQTTSVLVSYYDGFVNTADSHFFPQLQRLHLQQSISDALW
uniref:C-type lectin domain-containing protein n=1 Tax=Nothobranchius furzeri TaxID=105023 RepID=A0A8C6LES2_NOTFU